MFSHTPLWRLISFNSHKLVTIIRAASIKSLPEKIRKYVISICEQVTPEEMYVCDGSDKEMNIFIQKMMNDGTIVALPKYCNCYLARTDPRDVARVESKTYITTTDKRDTIPEPAEGVVGKLGNWMSPEEMECNIKTKFKGCMRGRTIYVIPFSMGPPGGPLSKMGVQLTDSTYVAAASKVMTRMGEQVSKLMSECNQDEIVRCTHSVGVPTEPTTKPNPWPCNPEETLILHKPDEKLIVSYGSGYGGNSLLGKKCFALRIGSTIAKSEGWLAEHMLIMGITPPKGEKKYICAAFPSACGKTNLAMLTPKVPGYKIECVGDDIAWIKFNPDTKMFHAINPENGIFGVAPGTSCESNANAMRTIFKDTMFTNTAMTSDGGVWWEGMEEPPDDVKIIDWHGKPWDRKNRKKPAAHPNARFCAPARNLPIIDPNWESPEGVPISAILFGGRRPEGVPLIYQSFSWEHGVLIGAMMRSEATAAAEHKDKNVMHDPFAMRPFFGYNFGRYMQHWLDMPKLHQGIILPKIFHVNWFLKSKDGKWLWPGYGDNIRVLDWVLRRVSSDEECIATKTPIGFVPKVESINVEGLTDVNLKEALTVPLDFWKKEVESTTKYFCEQMPNDVPPQIWKELNELKKRIEESH